MRRITELLKMSDIEKESAQAFFVLFFLLPMAVKGWIGIYRISELSPRMGFIALAMAVFSIFIFYSSFKAFYENKNLIRTSGCGFALIYFSGIIFVYGLLLFLLGQSMAIFNSHPETTALSLLYFRYSLYYFFPACLLINVGRIMEKAESALPVEAEGISITTRA